MSELVPLKDSPELNRLLIRNARKSFEEISAITGIDAKEVAERLGALMRSRTWRDDLQEEWLLLQEVALLVDDIRERMSSWDVEDEGWASMARVQLQSIKLMMEQLEKRRKAVEGDLAKVTGAQAQMVANAFGVAMEMAVKQIAKEHPDWDVEVVRATLTEVLPAAIEQVERHVDD